LKSVDRFAVATLLEDLRRSVGNGEFGYRVQGLFAHVILHIGGSVQEIRAQGHPDIIAIIDGVTTFVEVEIASSRSRQHGLKVDDIEALTPSDPKLAGWLAILDCAFPVTWLIVDSKILMHRKPGSLNLATIRALSNQTISAKCTYEFTRIISENDSRLYNLTFSLLCSRALRGTLFK
jgi:hypothetical protein